MTDARYGAVAVRTVPGAACTLRIDVNAGRFGDGPPKALVGAAQADGSLAWSYPAPLVPSGSGQHRVRCASGRRGSETTVDFLILARPIDPAHFRVRIDAMDIAADMAGVNARPDASLVPARDAAAAALRSALADQWSAATRRLGSLEVVDSSADITIHVIAGRGIDEHRVAADRTQRVDLPVVNERGPLSRSLLMAAALHELGHIWCCYGDGAGGDGHWLEEVPDPRLGGINRFGLMNSVLHCARWIDRPAETERCPDRFSERELRAMGFRGIPAPPPDPCVAERDALAKQIDEFNGALDALSAEIAALRDQLPPTPGSRPAITRFVPPDRTPRPASAADALRDKIAALTRSYNEDVDARNALSTRLKALPPC